MTKFTENILAVCAIILGILALPVAFALWVKWWKVVWDFIGVWR